MNGVLSKFVGVGLFFVVIFVSGFWLSHSGRPYSAIFFNIHKLIALAGVVFMGWTIYQARGTAVFDTLAVGALVVTGACTVITIVSGGLQNVEPPLAMQAALGVVHKIFPYVTVASGAGTVVMLAMRGAGNGG